MGRYAGNNGGRLVVDSAETGRGPVNELNGSLGLDGGNGSVDILGRHPSSRETGRGRGGDRT